MTLLSIDFGTVHIGLAIASSPIAEPYSQLKNNEKLIPNLLNICEKENIERIVIGVSENQMLDLTRQFISQLKQHLGCPIIEYDETLSSQEAKDYLIQSGSKRKKRQNKDHQIAAAIILQSYLDDHPEIVFE